MIFHWAHAVGFSALLCSRLATAVSETTADLPRYNRGDPIPVSCLNRTIDNGEHVQDSQERLVYSSFPICKETGKPLELYFGVESDMTCTIDFISDEFYHLLEFYVHHDAPLTCRVPARPMAYNTPSMKDASFTPEHTVGAIGGDSSAYIPMIFALTGTLQRSHIHIANNLNVLVHATPKEASPGVIDAAAAYSISHSTRMKKIIIGESLPLQLSVRWYHTPGLPSGWQGVGGHLTMTTLIYCLLCAGASAAICTAYFRGVELPRRLKTQLRDRVGLTRADSYRGGYGYSLPQYSNGGAAFGATGKFD